MSRSNLAVAAAVTCLTGLLCTVAAAQLRGDAIASGLDLDGYLRLAEEHSPLLHSARARFAAASERPGRVGGLPDPMVTYGHYFEEVETRVGPQVQRFGVRQKLPWFGKLSLARNAEEERARAEGERLRAVRLDVALNVTRAYSDYAYLARAIEITEERVALLTGLEGVVRARYASGDASYGDLMKAQIGLAKVSDALASLRDRRGALAYRLVAAVGLPDETDLPLPEQISGAVAPSEDVALAVFEESSPDLLALDHELEAARHQRRLAGRSYLPDLTIGIDYIVTDEASMPVTDSGKDPLIGVASINLPLWFGKHAAAVDEAEATLLAVERQREQRENELTAMLRMTVFEVRDAERRVELYRDRLVPLAQQSVAAADASYQTGKADFDALVGAHEAALELELGLERARADLAIRGAELARRMGIELSR